jgi:cation diffusion facilitator family transporter
MNWIRQYTPQPEQLQLYRKALIVTVIGNVLLAVGKGIAAYLSGSVALFADAANSISDVLYSILMVLGLWLALRPPDMSHPQGHSRFEPLVGLAVSASMAFAGYQALTTSYQRFMEGGLAVEPGLPTVVLLLSAGVKVGMYVYISRLADQLHSPTLQTTARDHISDVMTSSAAFVGAVGSSLVHPLLDPAAGFLVAIWIFRAVILTARENLGFLTGAGADEELRQRIVAQAEGVPGVLRVHHTMTEYVGPQLVVDMHVNVNGEISLNESHAIADEVIARLVDLPEVDRAYVHIEPEGWD